MTVFQPCLQRQTYKGKNEMGGTYFMEKTMLRRVMVGLTILVIALGVAKLSGQMFHQKEAVHLKAAFRCRDFRVSFATKNMHIE